VSTREPKPKTFTSRARLRAWLERNHATAPAVDLRLFKVHASERGVTYREALDEALCFGWIDGVRRAYDADSFRQRFSRRRPGSKWSQINRRRMRELQAAGLVAAPGLAALKAAPKKAAGYSFESEPVALAPRYLKQLKTNAKAFDYLQGQAPWYRRITSFYVMSAKQEATQLRRLDHLIACSARQQPISPLLNAKMRSRKNPA
jgi:uncharacterized protein YdeI (YjbR/CyaY-like superfamily)